MHLALVLFLLAGVNILLRLLSYLNDQHVEIYKRCQRLYTKGKIRGNAAVRENVFGEL